MLAKKFNAHMHTRGGDKHSLVRWGEGEGREEGAANIAIITVHEGQKNTRTRRGKTTTFSYRAKTRAHAAGIKKRNVHSGLANDGSNKSRHDHYVYSILAK